MAACEMSFSVVARCALEMTEDEASTVALNDLIDLDTQEFDISCSGGIAVRESLGGDVLAAEVTPSPDWNGAAGLSVSAHTATNAIDPPRPPETIWFEPPGPAVPPDPVPDVHYEFYAFDVSVAAVNDPPTAIDMGMLVLDEDTTLGPAFGIGACFHDIDSELSFSLAAPSGPHVLADLQYGGNVTIQPAEDWYGTESISLEATDGEYTVANVIPVTVLPVNDMPFASAAGELVEIDEDSNTTILLTEYIADVDDALAYGYITDDGNSSISIDNGSWALTVEPSEDWSGAINITVFASDAESTVARNLTVQVLPVNDPPRALQCNGIAMDEDGSAAVCLADILTDKDSQLSYSVFSCSGRLDCSAADGANWTVRPAEDDWFGTDTLRIIATDGEYVVTEDIEVSVIPHNDAPRCVGAVEQLTLFEDSQQVLDFGSMFSDPDGDALVYEISGQAGMGVERLDGTILRLVPDSDWSGETALTLLARDGALRAERVIAVTVAGVNDPPYQSLSLPAIVIGSGNSTTIDLSAYFGDVDSDTLDFDVSGGVNLTVEMVEPGLYTIAAPESWAGTERLTIMASDGQDSATASIAATAFKADTVYQEAAAPDLGMYQALSWMGMGGMLAAALFAMYAATRVQRPNTRPRRAGGRIL
jgi:hypothetical protein